MDDVRRQFADFLGLAVEPVNESEELEPEADPESEPRIQLPSLRGEEPIGREENEELLKSPRGSEGSADEQHVGSTELLQEIKDLDEHNPELARDDFGYWKPVIDYSFDDLMNELKG